MSSTTGIRVYSSINVHKSLERRRLCRVSTRNLSFGRQTLEKSWFAPELAIEKPRDSRTGFKCRNCVPDAERENCAVRRKKLAVFVSGGGSNFRSVHEASVAGLVHGDVAVLVTDKPDSIKIGG